MNLHTNKEEFEELCLVTSEYIGIPEAAVKRDYYIVKLLQNLQNSDFASECVFKGGTSLSKCYPGSINRFSEDIDLTFIPQEELSDNQYSKRLKKIEEIIIGDAESQPINGERSNRNKSSYVLFEEDSRVKLEIGSSVMPDPYEEKTLKTYIQEFLESKDMSDEIKEYELEEVRVNVLSIQRTFLDKVFSVKRHAIDGTITEKVRHIYDVTQLFKMKEIKDFIKDKQNLKNLVKKTKETDSFYLEKRDKQSKYNPLEKYDFNSWKKCFTAEVKKRYESLHEDLVYGNEKQDFNEAMETFNAINDLFEEIDE
ncbi:MAG: nucleotidyl transferase AbiEii/AbiGii toxin family protein [Clostridiaceae bacterium]